MRTLNDYFLTGTIDDVSTAFTSRVAVPDGGRVIKIITVLGGTIATADADQRFLVVEYTLEAKIEASSGMVTVVTVS